MSTDMSTECWLICRLMGGLSTHDPTLLLTSTGINMIYSPENTKLMNQKQKVLFGGKQLKDNTQRIGKDITGKATVYHNINKLELLVCSAENCEQNFLGGGEKLPKFPVCQKFYAVKQEFQRV